jgi:hypothetical protein
LEYGGLFKKKIGSQWGFDILPTTGNKDEILGQNSAAGSFLPARFSLSLQLPPPSQNMLLGEGAV